MLRTITTKIFGSRNQRVIKRYSKQVHLINELEPAMQALSDELLKAKTIEFKKRLAEGAGLDTLLPEAFAVVREASVRTLGLRHFDVQLIGGMVLHSGKIAEMCTGEGKTLMSTLPVYLNALTGRGVHIVTVNDYLAKRDAEWMLPIYEFLGMTVGINLTQMGHDEKAVAYKADITYGTNNEFGFDYLRDNMAFSLEERVLGDLAFAIVDEVDSILIDEARTPLIISGPAEDSSELYRNIDKIIPKLQKQEKEEGPGDYSLDEKSKQAHLTEAGHQTIEELFIEAGLLTEGDSLYAPKNIMLMHHLSAALRAHTLFHVDVDYIVKDDEIVIVDEHTGRTMPGRRWSEGLHQAVEAKERVKIQNENQTLASITFQNFFRLYDKLAGMTGTADTEAYEFQQIYGLEVAVVPTNRPLVREDHSDVVYLSVEEKYEAIVEDIEATRNTGQPILVGTASIETSEYLSDLLKKSDIQHSVLNAKFHEKEAQIIAEAGRPGTVTIATNMAGRGTDIVLGGNVEVEIAELNNPSEADIEAAKVDWQQRHEAVIAAGGLYVLGTERHESRRIDNQLRGRSGRQGDPGASRFYLSLQDNLMRIFASDRVAMIMNKGMKRGEALVHPWVSKAIQSAQRKVEAYNFDVRKQLLEYDDVANEQRKVIYDRRAQLMRLDDIGADVKVLWNSVLNREIDAYIPPESLEELWDVKGLEQRLESEFAMQPVIVGWLEDDHHMHEETLREQVVDILQNTYTEKEVQVGVDIMRQFEKSVVLQSLDTHWREHLSDMDHLRQGIHLRGYAQQNPKQEYKRESFILFKDMLESWEQDVVTILSRVEVQAQEDVDAVEAQRRLASERSMEFQHSDFAGPVSEAPEALSEPAESVSYNADNVVPFVRDGQKVGRNDLCPCGSGKKYKQCHGKL